MLAVVLTGSPAWSDAPPAREMALVACYRQLASAVGEEVWPGWSAAPSSLLLVTAEREFLICPPAGVSGFTAVSEDATLGCRILERSPQHAANLLATFPAFSTEPTIVVGTPAATGKAEGAWAITLLHEHFHQLQYSRPGYFDKTAALGLSKGDQTGMWMLNYPFPYETAAVGEAFAVFAKALGRALKARGSPDFAATLRAAKMAWWQFREALTPEDYRYFQFQAWQEGVARYVELRAASAAAGRLRGPCAERIDARRIADQMLERMETELAAPALKESRREAFYAVGAAIALLLDETSPAWKTRYFEQPFAMEGYFAP